MPFIISPETTQYNGQLGLESPYATPNARTPAYTIVGDNGKKYHVVQAESGGTDSDITVFELDKDHVTRTVVQTEDSSSLNSKVVATSGLSGETGHKVWGVLGNTGYLLLISWGIFAHAVFSLWKVNSSGHFDCAAAIAYEHGPFSTVYMYRRAVCGISGNGGMNDAIVAVYLGFLSYQLYIRAIRLPSINAFLGYNGTSFPEAVTNRNIKAIDDGDYLNTSPVLNSSRGFYKWGWLLPSSTGSTRLYFMVNSDDADRVGTDSPWITTNAALYGNQLVGYINLGNVSFSTTTDWVPGLTKVLDQETLQDETGTYPYMPWNAVDASGSTADSDGSNDFCIGPRVQPRNDGTYIVTFATLINTLRHSNAYSGSPANFIGRYMSFLYTPATGKHVLIAKQSFQPCDRYTVTETYDTFGRLEAMVEYDEDKGSYFYNFQVSVPSLPEDRAYTDIWGSVGLVGVGIPAATPCFLEESDPAYYDFVAKYP